MTFSQAAASSESGGVQLDGISVVSTAQAPRPGKNSQRAHSLAQNAAAYEPCQKRPSGPTNKL